jgi:hypothetical protein
LRHARQRRTARIDDPVDEQRRAITQSEARRVRGAIDRQVERHGERDAATVDAGDRARAVRRRDGVEQREDRAAVRGIGQALEVRIEDDDARGAVAAGGAFQDRVRRERGGVGHREIVMR